MFENNNFSNSSNIIRLPSTIETTTNVVQKACEKNSFEGNEIMDIIPDVDKSQRTHNYSNCTGYSDTSCICTTIDDATSIKRSINIEYRNGITTERLSDLRKKAQEALNQHKTFTVRGCFCSIRKSLISRGWIEKLDINWRRVVNENLSQNLPQRRPGETRRQHVKKCEQNIMSRFLEHMPIDFLWSARKEKADWIDVSKNPYLMINKLFKIPFTTKEGLCTILKSMHWFFEEGISEIYYPRTYNVWNADEIDDFCYDYRLTACISMLRFIVETSLDITKIINPKGKVPVTSVRFAIKQCKLFVREKQHFDIDEDEERIWDHEWEVFLVHYKMVTIDHAGVQMSVDDMEWKILFAEINYTYDEMKKYWPQSMLDGVRNIWIVKPSNRCRGSGIQVMNDLKAIINFINPTVINKGRYIVQKYIERPLTIHNCKFDIRQWFLVTSVQPMIIWMYQESYLRFSSQEYDLVNFHESVHLTNYAIQKRYSNGTRDERLPRDNMWDCYSFQAYLRQIDKAEMWNERIYPGMRKALVGTMLASQDSMDRRTNSFELFGADFMISEDFQPWLIEINSSPDLSASTSITARLCPQCLEDIIKVVVDHRNDPKASTGKFEMIYRQNIPSAPAYLGLNLCLKGTQIAPKYKFNRKQKNKMENQKTCGSRRPSYPLESTLVSPRPLIINFDEEIPNSKTPKSTNVRTKIGEIIPLRVRGNEVQPKGTSLVGNHEVNLKCVGNKCASKTAETRKISSQRQKSYILRLRKRSASHSSKKIVDLNIRDVNVGKLSVASPINIKEYRKYLAENKFTSSKSASKCSFGEQNHFYAIGLSLRAWRSKYNRLLKSSNVVDVKNVP